MIGFGRRSGPLLVGLSVGAMLVGVVALAQPDAARPADLVYAPAAGPTSASAATSTATAPVLPLAAPPTTTRAAATTARTRPSVTKKPAAVALSAPTTRRTTSAAAGSQAAQVVALTNQARAKAGCDALRVDARLTAAAQGHSADMAANDYFEHDGLDGSTFSDRIEAQGYPSPGGENIAQGQQDAREVVTAWLNSPGHRRNIEDCSFTAIGVGLAGAEKYWTQDFGR